MLPPQVCQLVFQADIDYAEGLSENKTCSQMVTSQMAHRGTRGFPTELSFSLGKNKLFGSPNALTKFQIFLSEDWHWISGGWLDLILIPLLCFF